MSPAKETIKEDTEKQKGLAAVIASIEKQYGKGAIMSGEDHISDIEFISTGCLSLDKALGGGFAKGRIAEIVGPESSGKSTVALHVAASCQKQGGVVAYLDVEHSLDLHYSESLGVNTEQLLIAQPANAEEGLNIMNLLTQSGCVDLIVLDSIAALVPQAELAGDIGDSHMGLLARIVNQALRITVGSISKTNTTVLLINQIRMKIGTAAMFGNPETSPGGNGIKFAASQRVDIRTIGKDKMGEEITGQFTRVKVIKNKVARPFKECEFRLEHGHGIDKYSDLLNVAIEKQLLDKAASWYAYEGERIGQGEPTAIKWLKDNPVIFDKLYGQLTGSN